MKNDAPIQLLDHNGDPIARSVYARPAAMHNSYHNAKRDRTRNGTRGPLGSVNAHHDKRTLDDLMRDCGQLVRNSVIAQAIVRKHIDCVVGAEVVADPKSGDKEWDTDVQRRFARFAESLDLTGQQTLTGIAADVVKSWFTSGGKLAHKVAFEGGFLRLEMIEAARLMNEAGRPDTRDLIGGVQLHPATGRPTHYHIADWNEQGTALEYNAKPYAARHLWLINDPFMLEAGQYRAVPRLAPYIDKIEALEVACKSTMGAYQLATFVALFITRNQAEGVSTADQFAQHQVSSGNATSVQDAVDRGVWEPMSIMEGQPGEGVQQITPGSPTTQWDQYIWTELQMICGPLGLPLELVFGRFIKNWSASKSAISVAWQRVRSDQQWLKRKLLIPVYQWWLRNELDAGRIEYPAAEGADWSAVDFIMPQQPVLDPKLEAEAQVAAVEGKLKLHSTAVREFGSGDYDTFVEQSKQEREMRDAAGMEITQPKQVTKSEQEETGGKDGAEKKNTADAGSADA